MGRLGGGAPLSVVCGCCTTPFLIDFVFFFSFFWGGWWVVWLVGWLTQFSEILFSLGSFTPCSPSLPTDKPRPNFVHLLLNQLSAKLFLNVL